MRHSPVFLAAALLAACQPPRPASPPTATYRCADGRLVQATYESPAHAVLAMGRATHRLTLAVSASGARYVGEGWQWWTKGMHEAWLAPLLSGESLASVPGVACRAERAP